MGRYISTKTVNRRKSAPLDKRSKRSAPPSLKPPNPTHKPGSRIPAGGKKKA
jgi:hypothetical protein